MAGDVFRMIAATRLHCLPVLLLVLALLAAWQTALLHPILHIANGGFVHAGAPQKAPVPGGKKDGESLCDAISAAASCVAGDNAALSPGPQRRSAVPFAVFAAIQGAPTPAYRSQAPPNLL